MFVGLAPNRYLSKIASDLCKPDGLTVFLLRDLPQALYCLKLSDLVGVGYAMEKRIHGAGSRRSNSCASFRQNRCGGYGTGPWRAALHWLRGADFHSPSSNARASASSTFSSQVPKREQAFFVALKLLHVSAQLRKLKCGLAALVRS